MINTKVLAISREKVVYLTKLVALLSVAMIVPLFHQQMITGPIVNTTLFVATAVLGVSGGILVGLIPSVVALSVGLLPPVLAPMVPFIMIGNTIMVLAFYFLKERNFSRQRRASSPVNAQQFSAEIEPRTYFRTDTSFWQGMILGSVLKFVFLYSTSAVVINLLLQKEVAAQVSLMMSWPQLLTALAGGCLAYVFIKWSKA